MGSGPGLYICSSHAPLLVQIEANVTNSMVQKRIPEDLVVNRHENKVAASVESLKSESNVPAGKILSCDTL